VVVISMACYFHFVLYASTLTAFSMVGLLSGFSTADSEFVSIVCWARMFSTGDNGIILVRASEG
jgi:hypothetical protein